MPFMNRGLFSHEISREDVRTDGRMDSREVGKLVKFCILIYSDPLHKYPLKEGFLTSWGMKSNNKPCRQHHRLTMAHYGDFSIAIGSL